MKGMAGAIGQSATVGVGWQQIRALLRPWRWLILLIACCVLTAQWFELVPPLLMRQIVDQYLAPGRGAGVLRLAWLSLGAIVVAEFFSFLASYTTAYVAQGALRDLRVHLVDHLHRLPLAYYDRTPVGDVISRCTADVDTVDTLFSSGVADVAVNLVRLATATLAMLLLSPALTVAAMLSVPPLVAIMRWLQRRTRDAERANRSAVGVLNAHVQETLAGVEVIRAFGRERPFGLRFRGALQQALAASNRATRYAAINLPLIGMLSALATAGLLWAGTMGVAASWEISIGMLTAFVLLYQRFFAPITTLGNDWQTVQSALAGLERIVQVLALPPEAAPVQAARPLLGRSTLVELAHVWYGYLPDQPVLHDVSLSVEPGEHVALVGRTGSGKTSVLQLIGGLYPPWSGTVHLVGCDPRAVPPAARRHLVGVVPQMVQLFSGTVLENLTLGDAPLSRAQVERAAAITGADTFIRTLPDGYDTWLSGSGRGRGVQLSAGQRQLLALTRALVWEPKVLLLDEATDAIDHVSDAQLRAALRHDRASPERAVVTVVHRLATAREADRVIVIDAGRIVEAGSPDELIRCNGRFAALVEIEAAGWDWRL